MSAPHIILDCTLFAIFVPKIVRLAFLRHCV